MKIFSENFLIKFYFRNWIYIWAKYPSYYHSTLISDCTGKKLRIYEKWENLGLDIILPDLPKLYHFRGLYEGLVDQFEKSWYNLILVEFSVFHGFCLTSSRPLTNIFKGSVVKKIVFIFVVSNLCQNINFLLVEFLFFRVLSGSKKINSSSLFLIGP
jgi:hypothetical protein